MSKTSLCSGEEAVVGTTMDDSDSDDHSAIEVEEELQAEEGREHILRWAWWIKYGDGVMKLVVVAVVGACDNEIMS